ncbi:heavy-metal-associated domain-containing protein [Marisediminicola senii]|uniref:heavy-metal-associated domain-containing protein n=1 Tax=Marisediminicola senii TaxID=2711233 RepID=UPI0013EB93C5|nr:cation transporter [Marisediminicola senii]
MSTNTPDTSASASYLVDGMTCGHCVASVTEEVAEIDGVQGVSVDLNVGGSSTVTVVSAQPIAAELIDAAITEAGYQLAPSR